jgi:hypothetical protein
VALKDLIADQTKVTEETIEKIISPYVRFDAASRRIVWIPRGRPIANDVKVLVFLVAVLGWRYVLDESQNVATKPADLERELGIAGGSLRPVLKKLKDSHLLTVADGHYRVQAANLDSIAATVAREVTMAAAKPRARKVAKAKHEKAERTDLDAVVEPKKKNRGPAGQLTTFLKKWIGDGFFNEPKTLANLLERYHEHGIITKQTTLSGLMLDAVRDGLLARTRIEQRGKQVWAYRARGS